MSLFAKKPAVAPAPNVNKETTAIDLGSAYVKIAVTDKNGQITQTVIAANPLGFAVPTKNTQIEPLANLLKNIFLEYKLPRRNVALAMSEKFVSTEVIEIPYLTDSELASSINWQAQQYIPIPQEELVLNYQVLFRPDKKDAGSQNMRVLLVGINRTNVNNLIAAYKQAGLEPTVMETESLATLRHYQNDDPNSSAMIVNFGASGMDLTLLHDNEIAYVISHQTGSDMITKALMSTFNLTHDKADEYKMAYGIDSSFAQGRIAQAIVPIAQTILTDIKNTLTFYNNKNVANPVKSLILTGGGVQMPGFKELLSVNLNTPAVILDTFANLNGQIPENNHAMFPVATGLIKRKQ